MNCRPLLAGALLFFVTSAASAQSTNLNPNPPSGAAGGILSGTYPNPGFASPLAVGPASAGTIDNMAIGGTTPLAVTGTTLTSTTQSVSTALLIGGTTNASTGPASNQNGTIQINSTGSSAAGWAGGSIFLNHWSNDAVGSVIPLTKSRGAAIGTNTVVQNGDALGQVNFRGADGSNYPNAASIMTVVDNTPGTGIVPGSMIFKVADHTSGALTTVLTLNSSEQIVLTGVTTGTNADFLCLSGAGVVLLQSTACTISSQRFKHDIEAVDTEESLQAVMRMRPVSFVMSERNRDENGNRYQIGLIAEEVEKIDRAMAVYEDDGVTPKSYRQESVLAEAIGAIQALKAENDTLRRRVTALEHR